MNSVHPGALAASARALTGRYNPGSHIVTHAEKEYGQDCAMTLVLLMLL